MARWGATIRLSRSQEGETLCKDVIDDIPQVLGWLFIVVAPVALSFAFTFK
jgi:hypothetical protein